MALSQPTQKNMEAAAWRGAPCPLSGAVIYPKNVSHGRKGTIRSRQCQNTWLAGLGPAMTFLGSKISSQVESAKKREGASLSQGALNTYCKPWARSPPFGKGDGCPS